MDRNEAHKLLGLYLGASNSQIDAKLAELEADARTKLAGDDLEVRVAELRAARDTALGKPTIIMVAPAKPPLLRRGPVVLLMIGLALALCVGLFFIAAKYLDNKQAERRTGEQRDRTAAARDAWQGYCRSIGIGQSQDGQLAEAQFEGAQKLFDQGDYSHAADDYTVAMQLYNSAFAAEDARITRAWERDVLAFRREKLVGRFPFDPQAEAEAEADDVARLLNPGSGAIWAITREHDALAAIELEGRHFATPLKQRDELVKHGTRIRDALFGAHSPTIDVQFGIRISSPKALYELILEVGGATCSTRKEGTQQARWTQSDGGMKLTRNVAGGDNKDSTLDRSTSDWGLLRVLSFGEYVGERAGELVWEFDPDNISGKRVRGKDATIHIRPEAGISPFDLAMYAAFAG
jgi:type VI protein secretion system component VasK